MNNPDDQFGFPGSGIQPDPTAPNRPRRFSSLLSLAAVVLIVSLVAVPIGLAVLPAEIARWHQAAAQEKELEQDLEGAIESVDEALAWDPENAELYRLRAQYRLENQQYDQALADVNLAIEAAEQQEELAAGYQLRSEIYQYLGRHAEAVEDWKQIRHLSEELGASGSAHVLNGLAYARALAGSELEEGLADAKAALKLAGSDPAILDTRGFLYYQLGRFSEARADLDEAVPVMEQLLTNLQQRLPQAMDVREFRSEQQKLERSVAVLRYHRALIYQQLDRAEEAERDLERVRELGFEPGPQLF